MATPGPRPDQGSLNGLTGIPQPIHSGATDDPYDSETDKIAIDHFLDMLAEVAMSVASRQAQPDEPQGE